ncbi:hypothetical protein ACP4OV_011678 [Aristida adscensionis]
MQKKDVWPDQPFDLRQSRWILGDIIEVFYQNLWRPGKITKVLKNDHFVIRLPDFIQLREFHISCLRVPQTHHIQQSSVIDKDHQAYKEGGHRTKKHKSSNLCPSTSAIIVKKKLEARRMPPDNLIRRTSKKRKVAAYEVHQPTMNELPLKVSARNDINVDNMYRPFSNKQSNPAKIKFTKGNLDCEVLHSSRIPLHVRKENECSVASCSTNCLEYYISDGQQSVGLSNSFPEDAMSSCASPSMSEHEDNNMHCSDLDMNVHDLELQAYQCTVRAFYALGPLTWEQESLLTNLRLSLNISNEEHLLQLRRLLSS